MKRLDAQRNALWKDVGRSRERLLDCEIELVVELNNVKVKAPELKTSFGASAARVCCSGGELGSLKAAQAEEASDATHLVTANQSGRLDALQQRGDSIETS